MITIIRSPWQNIFLDLVQNTKQQILLASPFIKFQTVSKIIEIYNKNISDFKVINSFKLSYFHRGASDLNALKSLIDNGALVKNVHNLHAKIFIFDNIAVVTSGNLTPGGLSNNWEYGIKIDNELVNQIRDDYLNLFNNDENPIVNLDIITKAESILNSIPRERRKTIAVSDRSLFEDILNDHNVDEKYDAGVDTIIPNLSAWKKDVFECLINISEDIFTLEEVYSFKTKLQKMHPDNRNIEPKIRQQLQYLRDLGLLEFVKPGIYKKLWR